MLYSSLALLTVLATAYSQNIIEVPMKSNGNQYNIRFLSSSPLADVTREFCINNAESLGITPLTEASLPGCQQPIANYIQEYVQASFAAEPAAQEVIGVQLDINSVQYNLRFNPTAESILAVSRDFCISNQEALAITPLTEESLPGCQTPVVEYMRVAAMKHLEGTTTTAATTTAATTPAATPAAMQVVLNIMDQQVSFQVLPTEASVLSVSRDFCINNAEALKISPLTEESLPSCQQPLVDALVGAVRQQAAAAAESEAQAQAAQQQAVEIKVDISGNQYLVRFKPAVEAVSQVARDFCINNAASLGITPLSEASLPACLTPVAQYLQAQLQTVM